MNLDELQNEVEKLLSLLRAREIGLMSWNELLLDRLKTIHQFIHQAKVE